MCSLVDYASNSIVTKTIFKRATGNVSALSFDSGESLTGKTSPFNTLVEIIEGKAEVVINGISNLLETGQFIIIPAHSRNTIRANVRFKMMSTIIKSGYE